MARACLHQTIWQINEVNVNRKSNKGHSQLLVAFSDPNFLFSLYKLSVHPEPLSISDPSVSAVTHTMAARKVTQMNLILLFKSSSSVHITGGVTAAWNPSQPLCGILTFVHKEILDSWAKSIGKALYKIMWFLWRQGKLLAIEFFSNERYLPGAGVWNRPSLTLVWGH